MNRLDELFKEVSETVSPVYAVGGCVRDTILEKEPKDYDFTTPLTPDEIEDGVHAASRRAYLTGKKFGTIGFKCSGEFIEVTTFRKERYQANNRKPEVEFVSDLREDLKRRDFTINAIAFDGKKYIDPHGGRLDILQRMIKSVGEARERFKEDPLRMLRAARFASQLGFAVDPNMVGKIRAMADKITTVSRERWVQELDKLLMGKDINYGFAILLDTYLIKYMLPEVWNLCVLSKEYESEIYANFRNSEGNLDARWAALLLTIGKPFVRKDNHGTITFPKHEIIGLEMAKGICSRLKFSNDRTAYVLNAISKQKLP